jgi:hypothetical protein
VDVYEDLFLLGDPFRNVAIYKIDENYAITRVA